MAALKNNEGYLKQRTTNKDTKLEVSHSLTIHEVIESMFLMMKREEILSKIRNDEK